jgi:hypothetical protein
MVVDSDVEHVRLKLDHDDAAQLSLYGADVYARTTHDASQILLRSPVYVGSAYIPISIRNCLEKGENPFITTTLSTYLTIDELTYSLFLNYHGNYDEDTMTLKDLLEEFGYQAAEWRLYLDEKDRHDRVYIHVR